MNGTEFVKKVAEVLRDNNITKSINIPKTVFTISDKNGNKKDFAVESPKGEVKYTIEDVNKIIEAAYAVIEDSIKRGEDISFHGIGRFCIKKVKGQICKAPGNGQWYEIPSRYVAKFKPGAALRMAAQFYTNKLKESSLGEPPEPIYDKLDDEFEGDLDLEFDKAGDE